ncbi:tetratricopeptide repeat protein, partial [Streptomyces sp. NRRL B-24484]|uniref:tetratricopeptide repeat protein n=1 Tax=Streptomyces sp. NRRL B-24484 TaxID=1463833 RepID=UPI001331B809
MRGLCAEGEFGRAWEVVEPFAATGWQPAVRVGADVLVRWGRVEQALELAHPGSRETEPRGAWPDYAEVLAGAGRVDEAIDVLVPRLREDRALRALVRITEGRGRDDRVLELLTPVAEEFGRGPDSCGVRDLWNALPMRALVLERSGRVDEAIALLGADVAARRYGPQNTVEFYADLLARNGRIDELRDLATGPQQPTVSAAYVTALQDLGRSGEAEAFLRGLVDTVTHPTRYESALLVLLARQGRFDEAVAVVAHTFDDLHDTNLLQSTIIVLAEHGLPDRALELTEGRSAAYMEENGQYWIPSNRWWLLGDAGRCREALAEIEAVADTEEPSPGEIDDREATVGRLLAQDGREEEAVAHLRRCPGRSAAVELAQLLIRQGRCAEAIAAVPDLAAQREEE